ncbi:hypothetical protein RV14_GL002083 [Enterococcus ratti]|uniref:Uncharacterized protein n=1 Tax=Enterococcus ratti TaxID=150033 RepID=A0A1L8WP30_9ENTE|nr:hypothetical protein RV14_GL002083 [Enterococcus ratti]
MYQTNHFFMQYKKIVTIKTSRRSQKFETLIFVIVCLFFIH